jgi:hypothetical protein
MTRTSEYPRIREPYLEIAKRDRYCPAAPEDGMGSIKSTSTARN